METLQHELLNNLGKRCNFIIALYNLITLTILEFLQYDLVSMETLQHDRVGNCSIKQGSAQQATKKRVHGNITT